MAKNCDECATFKNLLAGNIELQIKLTRLYDAVTNHKLNCQVSTAVDEDLWTTVRRIKDNNVK